MFEFVLRLRGAIGAMLAAAVVLAAAAGPSLANGEGWTVLETKGAVVVLRAEQGVVALRQGDQVAPGDRVKTGADGHVRLTQGGDFITGSPNGELEIPLAPGKDNGPDVLQRMGTFIYKMVKRPVDRFRVKTPYLTAVIKGTTFAVGVTDAGATLHVTEGAVQVRSAVTGAAGLVRPGHTAVVSRNATRPMRIYRPDSPKRDDQTRGPSQHAPDTTKNHAQSGGFVDTGNAKLRLITTLDVGAVDVGDASGGLVKGPSRTAIGLTSAKSKAGPAASRGVKSSGETAASPRAVSRLSEIAGRAASNASATSGASSGAAGAGIGRSVGTSGSATGGSSAVSHGNGGGYGVSNAGGNSSGYGGSNGNGVVNGGGNSGIKAGTGGNGSNNAGGNGSGAVKVDGNGSVIAGISSDDNGNTGGNGNAGGNSGSSNAGGNGGGSGGAQVALNGNGNAGGNGKSNAGGNGNGGGKGKGK